MRRVVGAGLTAGVLALVAVPLVGGSTTRASAALRTATGCTAVYKYCNPGRLPAGVYTTRYFLAGMRVTLPGSGWTSHQDSTTEFKLSPPGYTNPSTTPVIRFWIDPRVGTACTDKLLPVNISTPALAVRWMETDKSFNISARASTTISDHLTALRVDYDVSPKAPKCSPSCPSSCIDYFDFVGGPEPAAADLAPGHTPGIKDGFGSGADDPVRLYFAHIGSPSRSHLFMVGVETPNRTDMTRLRTDAATMLAHLHLPAKLPRTGKR